jgi:hypothetical protein
MTQDTLHYEEEKHMPYITSFEHFGRAQGLLAGIETCLKLKFGADGLNPMPEIRALEDHETLKSILEAIESAASPDDLRRVWARGRRPKKGRRTR